MFKGINEINNIIGLREDVDNVLTDVNKFLIKTLDQAFCIGVGPDGPTATWSRRFANGNLVLTIHMQEIAAILRRKLDIAAHVVP